MMRSFYINIIGGLHWEMETELNATWLAKSLREALIGPALKAYFKEDIGQAACTPEQVKVEINGTLISNNELKKALNVLVGDAVPPGQEPDRVDISLPTRTYELTKIIR
jgi:hypothetical protein